MSDGFLRGGKGRLLLGIFLLLLAGLLLARWTVAVYVDFLWFAAHGATRVFLTRFAWEWGGRLFAGLVVGLLTWANLRVVVRTFAGIQIRRRFGDLVIQEQLPESYVRWAIWAGCFLVGLWFAAAIPQGTGLRGLLLLNAEPWGTAEPILGRDLGFYLFTLPVLEGVVTFGLVVSVFLAGLVAAGYSATGAIQWGDGRVQVHELPRVHLGIMAAAFLVLLALRFHLAPFGLLQDGNSGVQGIFGYADHGARIPAYRILTLATLAAAGVMVWAVLRNRLLLVAVAAGALALATVVAGQVVPSVVQRFQVVPNELAREAPYIGHAVAHTRLGFDLADVRRERLPYERPRDAHWAIALDRLSRLPAWTEPTLLATFRQIDARFEYYDFHSVAFVRYEAGPSEAPVAVSVRELDPNDIPDPNWQNLHLRERFIAGRGAVAGHLNRRTDAGRLPMFLTGIDPVVRTEDAPEGLHLERPSIFVGSRPQLYAVINPGAEDFLAPDSTQGVAGTDFPSGIRMGSIFRTAALAWNFRDPNLLLASEVGSDSRFVYRRDARERVNALAPFLLVPEEPYPVVANGRVVWIVEGFTASRHFPLAREHEIVERRAARYVRNSVKATVDALTGETRLYAMDAEDPLLAAYRRSFPTLFHDPGAMPAEIARHLRYSRVLFDVQSRVLLQYHQESPPVFHGQQQRWAVATELSVNTEQTPYRPEYGFLTLPGEEEEEWVLSSVFVPQGRQNLAAFLAARWSGGEGGELLLWDVPVESQVRGPRQIEALVEQDPEISQQFSLWRQGGSEVWTGHLHLVPVGTSLLYMEPVFLAADSEAIPEIRRYVVSDGNRVVMDPTLEGAVRGLELGLEGVVRETADEPTPGEEAEAAAEEPGGLPTADDALRLLEEAEERLRVGDWEGFGQKLSELREHLRGSAGGGR